MSGFKKKRLKKVYFKNKLILIIIQYFAARKELMTQPI